MGGSGHRRPESQWLPAYIGLLFCGSPRNLRALTGSCADQTNHSKQTTGTRTCILAKRNRENHFPFSPADLADPEISTCWIKRQRLNSGYRDSEMPAFAWRFKQPSRAISEETTDHRAKPDARDDARLVKTGRLTSTAVCYMPNLSNLFPTLADSNARYRTRLTR